MRTIISCITLISFVVCLHGCYSVHMVRADEIQEPSEYTIVKITTIDGTVYEFAEPADLVSDKIVGYVTDGTFIQIPIEEVLTIYVKEFDIVKTGAAAFGYLALTAAAACVAIIITLSQMDFSHSCPFIYSFNGEKYVLDGEPYGGAVCQGLQRDDVSRLDYIRPVNGEYRIMLSNELDEIQYTDEFKLCVVDFPEGLDVFQDADGNFYAVKELHEPLFAIDSHDHDWSFFLSQVDDLLWETDIMSKDPDSKSDLRDTLFIAFPRVRDASRGKLIVSGCNTMWGSYMLKPMIDLYGNQVDEWYEEMMTPASQEFIAQWNDRVEIYQLQVYVWEDSAWIHRGEIMGGGPVVAETRVVPLDLTGVGGDTVKIRIAPPSGFWQLNSFAMDYSHDVAIHVTEIAATSMLTHDGADVRAALHSLDSNYYVMPEVGDHAFFTFSLPPMQPNTDRVVFAKVSGYYKLDIDTSRAPDSEIVHRILSDPEYVVQFGLQEWAKRHSISTRE